MSRLTLIIGGARSGKSSFAEKLAFKRAKGKVLYVATARALDTEMRDRVQVHQRKRHRSWKTLEAPFYLKRALMKQRASKRLVLIDCFTFYLANPYMNALPHPFTETARKRFEGKLLIETRALARYLAHRKTQTIVVSNEIGSGIVPDHRMGRAFRDLLGTANQTIARASQEVYHVVAGIPTRIK